MSDFEIHKNCVSLVLDCLRKVQTITDSGPDTLIVWGNASVSLLVSAIKAGKTKEEVEEIVESILSQIKSETVEYYLSMQEEK